MPMAVCPLSKVEQLENNIISIFVFSLQVPFTLSTSIDLFLPSGHHYKSPNKGVSLHPLFNATSQPSTLESHELHSSGCMFCALCDQSQGQSLRYDPDVCRKATLKTMSPPGHDDYHVGMIQSQRCMQNANKCHSFDCDMMSHECNSSIT